MSWSLKQLRLVHKIVLKKLTKIDDIQSVFGIGSYFAKNSTLPHDIDYYVILNKKFFDLDIGRLSDFLETIKGLYRNEKSEPLVNIFLEDTKGNKLNSVDLWFIQNFSDETLDSCIRNRKNQIWVNKEPKLLFSRQ